MSTGDQAELGSACMFTAHSSLLLSQFELYFFFSPAGVVWFSVDD